MRRLLALALSAFIALAPASAQMMTTGVGASAAGGATSPTLPVGFNWTPIAPLTFGYNGTKFTTNFVPASYATAALAGTQYFVNGVSGLDANNCLSNGAKCKSIWHAVQLCNAAAVPCTINVDSVAGGYPREIGFTNTGTAVPPTQPIAYVATGGRVEAWTGSQLTWSGTPDPTFPNTYTATRSAVINVLNLTDNNVYGDYAELVQVADAATCNSTQSSWALVGTTLYVHRAGQETPTNANTRALLGSTLNFTTSASSKDVYMIGFDLQGGNSGAFYLAGVSTMNAIVVDSSAKYAAAGNNGFRFDNITGLAACVRCIGASNGADGINAHWSPGGTVLLYMLTIDSVGRNNGRGVNLSNNGLTAHDGVNFVDVNGEYSFNYGANVIPINTSQAYVLGTYAHDSFGDIVMGGATPPTDYNTQFTAQMWIQNSRSANSTDSLVAANTSTILLRNFSQTPGQQRVTSVGATIGSF